MGPPGEGIMLLEEFQLVEPAARLFRLIADIMMVWSN
jgi:hypothetical protein